MIPVYFLLLISNIKPAASPLKASRILAPCPMSAIPSEWTSVTALSRVLNKHAISITRTIMLIYNKILCLLPFAELSIIVLAAYLSVL